MNTYFQRYIRTTFVAALCLMFISSCQKADYMEISETYYEFTFESGAEGWKADFADYPAGEEAFYELESNISALPAPLDPQKKGFMLKGHNRSDDLFMFMTKQLTGLKPNRLYRVHFDLDIASNAPKSSVGIGGSPGVSVFLKAGTSTNEPQKINKNGFYELNIDKGNQAQGGMNMIVIGNVGIDAEKQSYTLINRNNHSAVYQARTDEKGNLWVIIGTDSGFEGLTTLYYDAVRISFTEQF